ncbi:MAG: ribulose-phosphate 3-epimerase, partial [Candidatus Hydrogenedentes bacterium]|nr:ribulose-phosphate 3-epimerase [Candidatus Hydrogenedentota bacterium]
ENVRAMIGDHDLEVDGGIDDKTAEEVINAGANVLVAGSYVFSREHSYTEAIDRLKSAGS